MSNWIEFNKENMPPPDKYVWVKRNKGGIYLAFRENYSLSTNPDVSRDCYWYGKALEEALYIKQPQCNFSDITVTHFMEIELPIND